MKRIVSFIIAVSIAISVFAIPAQASTYYTPSSAPISYEFYMNSPDYWSTVEFNQYAKRYQASRRTTIANAYTTKTISELGITPAQLAKIYVPYSVEFAIGEDLGIYNKDIVKMVIPIVTGGTDRSSLTLQFQLMRDTNTLSFHRAFIQLEKKGYALNEGVTYETNRYDMRPATYFMAEIAKGYNKKDSMYAPRPGENPFVFGLPALQPTGKHYVSYYEFIDPIGYKANKAIDEQIAIDAAIAAKKQDWASYAKANYMTRDEGHAYVQSVGGNAWRDVLAKQESVIKGMTWGELSQYTTGMNHNSSTYVNDRADVTGIVLLHHVMKVYYPETGGISDTVYCDFTITKQGKIVILKMSGISGFSISRENGATDADFRTIFEESNEIYDGFGIEKYIPYEGDNYLDDEYAF